jgi:outer membrane protein assembly factor BamA
VFNVHGRDWAARIRLGGAFTGAKTEVIPYDRGFFGGGANGVRGWPIRMLGPTSLGMGNLRADASAELRMTWTDANTVALFSDVGNVWNKSNIELADIAWSVGLGFRYDFDFFLLRLDTALRLHDPMKPIGERWIYQSKIVGGIHLGLGHPF